MDLTSIKGLGDLLSSVFSPDEANAEVIPEDDKAKQLVKKLIDAGGQGASTYRMAHMLSDKANVNYNKPAWDDSVKDQVFFSNTKYPKELTDLINSDTGAMYNNWTDKIAVNPVDRTTGPHPVDEKTYPKHGILGHELGHFLINKLNYKDNLRKENIDPEQFSNLLGGLPLNDNYKDKESQMRKMISEMFLKAISK